MGARAGIVYLVGAGPGDPGLMTARSLDLIATAETIFYDRLVPPGALDGARTDAELIYVGKEPGSPSVPQEEIERSMAEAAANGRSVVRLKGGDPFVFGRGAEEGETLRAAGIEFEVVPGVTAGVAASAYAGIPVTHRDDASAVAFITGHEDPGKPESMLDWPALASFPGTLVFYMGVKNLPRNSAALIEAGRDSGEPAAVVEQGTTPAQRVVVGTLASLPGIAEREGIRSPALIVVGAVAARREGLAWLERRPLHGRQIVVTRARAQASGFAAILRELGATVIELPSIRTEPLLDSDAVRNAVAAIHTYSLICLTSPNGVRYLFDAMAAEGRDARSLSNATIAAIGPGTAGALAEHGIAADIVPEKYVGEALAEALEPVEVNGRPVLIARASEARDTLPDALTARGAKLDVVALYQTVRETPGSAAIEAAESADYITFTSSSAVTNLLGVLGGSLPSGARIISIGPVTSETVRKAGFEVNAEAERHDIDGLVSTLLAVAAADLPTG